MDEARGLDVVALLVSENGGRGVGEQRAHLVVGGHALGDAFEGRQRIVAGGTKESRQRDRCVARDRREP